MKKQILILASIVMILIGFFLLMRRSSSNSGTLFEDARSSLETDALNDEDEGQTISVLTEDKEPILYEMVFVDVQGEVVNPGVFEVNNDVRVGYLITLAGGLTEYANVRGLNQAARIYDEMVIFVPHVDDENLLEIGVGDRDENRDADQSGLISLSTANALELQTLPGIGPAISANIIAHREANGAFLAIDELINVAGIGVGIVENIREFVEP